MPGAYEASKSKRGSTAQDRHRLVLDQMWDKASGFQHKVARRGIW